ncbi:hypothetical protein TWF102_005373 [Orbilia oligospora]|uniref:NB-ARC domain-containing protein n=1 Tax=Orbilia oligospora TaxID=2813651 RepID=A0A7C8NET9_ORBOL|nr:hypothetical protein TWF102_005373 [Orbilia oligospora]
MLLSCYILIINILPLAAAKKIPIEEYKIGWISALPIEFAAAQAVLDEEYEVPGSYTRLRDDNAYIFGRIGSHNTIIACLPAGRYGTVSAATVASQMYNTFPSIKFSLMVGIGGGAPSGRNDIRLGDVVVGLPTRDSSGVIQYDLGKTVSEGRFVKTGALNGPPLLALKAVVKLQAEHPKAFGERMADVAQRVTEKDDRFSYPGQGQDRLFRPEYEHIDDRLDCVDYCDFENLVHRDVRAHEYPLIHYGIIASANQALDSRALLSTTEYSHSQSKEDTRLIINYSIPFKIATPRLKSFVGRNDTLLAIYNYYSDCKILNEESSTPCLFAITGLGGAGKTQIALEYAYRYKKEFTSIFWINAESEDSIQRSILTAMQQIVDEQANYAYPGRNPNCTLIGNVFKIPRLIDDGCIIRAPNSKDQVELKNAFISWLESHPHNNHGWLLVFDNADDLETVNLEGYLPKLGWGAILITSRRQEFGPDIEQMDLQGLEPRFASHLLLQLLGINKANEETELQAMNIIGKFARREILSPESHRAHFTLPHLEYLSRHLKPRLTQIFSLPDPITEPRNLLIEIFLRTREALQPYGRVAEAKFWRRQALRATADAFLRRGRTLEAKTRYGIAATGYFITAWLRIRHGLSVIYGTALYFKCSMKLSKVHMYERTLFPICVTGSRVDGGDVFDAEDFEEKVQESFNRATMFLSGSDLYPEGTIYHKAGRYISKTFGLQGRLESDINSSISGLESALDFAEGEDWATKAFKLISSIYTRSFPETKGRIFELASPEQELY